MECGLNSNIACLQKTRCSTTHDGLCFVWLYMLLDMMAEPESISHSLFLSTFCHSFVLSFDFADEWWWRYFCQQRTAPVIQFGDFASCQRLLNIWINYCFNRLLAVKRSMKSTSYFFRHHRRWWRQWCIDSAYDFFLVSDYYLVCWNSRASSRIRKQKNDKFIIIYFVPNFIG